MLDRSSLNPYIWLMLPTGGHELKAAQQTYVDAGYDLAQQKVYTRRLFQIYLSDAPTPGASDVFFSILHKSQIRPENPVIEIPPSPD